MTLKDSRILIIGGTGSLGSALLKRLLQGESGGPARITVFSRDEAKQSKLKEEIGRNHSESPLPAGDRLTFLIGDVRDKDSLYTAITGHDIVIHAAALKQVDRCEHFPDQVVKTNIGGAMNLVTAIEQHPNPPATVIGVSTDKACLPVNAMGISKAMQEKIFASGDSRCRSTRFVSVRYGNVLASRGSVLPLFHRQVRQGDDITITDTECTRFFLSLDEAVETILYAIAYGKSGEIVVPKIRSCRVADIAECLASEGSVAVREIGMRGGEKIHETLVTTLEAQRAREEGRYYILEPEHKEPSSQRMSVSPNWEFTSETDPLSREETDAFLAENRMKVADSPVFDD